MNMTLEFEHVSLADFGPTMSLRISAGQCLTFVGLPRSGKTEMHNAIAGHTEPIRGEIRRHCPIHIPTPLTPSRRTKVQNLALAQGSSRDPIDGQRMTEALDALGLWGARKLSLADLTPQQLHAAILLPTLIGYHPVIMLDQILDAFDPLTLDKTFAVLKKRQSAGATLILTTHSADVAAHADLICVLRAKQIHFVGSPIDVIESAGPTIVTVATNRHEAVRALAEPFAISITESEEETKFEAADGQALAARMLVHGYGDVRYTVIRRPLFRDAFTRLLAQTVES